MESLRHHLQNRSLWGDKSLQNSLATTAHTLHNDDPERACGDDFSLQWYPTPTIQYPCTLLHYRTTVLATIELIGPIQYPDRPELITENMLKLVELTPNECVSVLLSTAYHMAPILSCVGDTGSSSRTSFDTCTSSLMKQGTCYCIPAIE